MTKDDEIAALRATVTAQETEITGLKQQIADLLAKLALDSQNSSKPPSSDPPPPQTPPRSQRSAVWRSIGPHGQGMTRRRRVWPGVSIA